MERVLEVMNVRFAYGERALLQQVSFAVYPGEAVAIIGSNGTGKSTLLRLLLGELKPDAGSIQMMGQAVVGGGALPQVGYVPQKGLTAISGFPATAEEIVRSGLFADIGTLRPARSLHRQKARQALARVGLEAYARSPVSTLSGGQLQRVLLARVLVSQPRLLLLDEPLSGIDGESADVIYHLLRKLTREEQVAVVMVTHDLVRAHADLDRVLCLEYGVLVEVEKDQLEHELHHRHRHPGIDGLPLPDDSGTQTPLAIGPACGWSPPVSNDPIQPPKGV